jgi:hypothetical protein
VSVVKGRTYPKNFRETDPHKNIWTQKGSNRRLEKSAVCFSPSIMRMIKSRKMNWAGFAARIAGT